MTSTSETGHAVPGPVKVLVVDDSLMVRQQVGFALSSAGYDVIEAEDGVQALEKLAAQSGPALMVLDVNMPKMSGLELLQEMRDRKSNVPVVMLTTEGQPKLMQQAKALGAKGWIIKPFRPELLIAAVRKITGTP